MKLTKDGWIGTLLKLTYGTTYDYNENGCNVFWAYVWAMLVLPFTGLSFPFFKVRDGFERFIMSVVTNMVTISLFLIFRGIYLNWWLAVQVIGVLILFIALIICLVALFVNLIKSETSEFLGESIKSFKDKYCPKIEWK